MPSPQQCSHSPSGTNDRNELTSAMETHIQNCVEELWALREICHLQANRGDDVIAHLLEFERLWERLNQNYPNHTRSLFLDNQEIMMRMATSLPKSWDSFITSLFNDPTKQDLNLHDFISECIQECEKHRTYSHEDIV
jgi:hypothetical protein